MASLVRFHLSGISTPFQNFQWGPLHRPQASVPWNHMPSAAPELLAGALGSGSGSAPVHPAQAKPEPRDPSAQLPSQGQTPTTVRPEPRLLGSERPPARPTPPGHPCHQGHLHHLHHPPLLCKGNHSDPRHSPSFSPPLMLISQCLQELLIYCFAAVFSGEQANITYCVMTGRGDSGKFFMSIEM